MNASPEKGPSATKETQSAPALMTLSKPVTDGRRYVKIVLTAVAAGLLLAWIAFRYTKTPALAPARITLYGNVDVRQVNLSFKVGGRVSSLTVDEGEQVTAGQIVATLDPTYFEQELRLAQAQVDQALANLDRLKNGSRPEEIEQAQALEAKARATWERSKKDLARSQTLIDSNSVSRQEFDATRDAFLEAQATLQAAEAATQLTELGPRIEDIAAGQSQYDAAAAQFMITQRRLEDSKLLAPNDGVILTRAREAGAIVNPGEVVFTLTLVSPVWVRTYVNETDLGHVQAGMKVTVETDTQTFIPSDNSNTSGVINEGNSSAQRTARDTYEGHIGFISPTAEFTPKSVETRDLRTNLVYRLRIVVDDSKGGLKQGMPVTVVVNLQGTQPRLFYDRFLEALGFDSSSSLDSKAH